MYHLYVAEDNNFGMQRRVLDCCGALCTASIYVNPAIDMPQN